MATRKSATNNGFLLFTDQLPILQCIPDESLGKAIKLLLENFETMNYIEEDNTTVLAYELIATNIRRYRQQSIKARKDGLNGGNPILVNRDKGTLKGRDKGTLKQQEKTRKDNTIQEEKKNNYNNIPTKEEIKNYCNLTARNIDIDTFYKYYNDLDWQDDYGNVINWKRYVNSWHLREEKNKCKVDEKERLKLVVKKMCGG